MKWPKKWIDTIYQQTKAIHDYNSELDDIREKVCNNILDDLHEMGALKDPPKPREWWVCPRCSSNEVPKHYCNCTESGEPLWGKAKEVTEYET